MKVESGVVEGGRCKIENPRRAAPASRIDDCDVSGFDVEAFTKIRSDRSCRFEFEHSSHIIVEKMSKMMKDDVKLVLESLSLEN